MYEISSLRVNCPNRNSKYNTANKHNTKKPSRISQIKNHVINTSHFISECWVDVFLFASRRQANL